MPEFDAFSSQRLNAFIIYFEILERARPIGKKQDHIHTFKTTKVSIKKWMTNAAVTLPARKHYSGVSTSFVSLGKRL
ncbi:hypothetical protein [Methanooceanicella nereidis]|uniref:hypothetical protein n=1 Tax=Methanooceanicella nereidis TaxID=2052831 RepID=UPI001E46D1CD|nr:hypothetical protein [Methanocella sp. CWC-04]